MPSPLSRLSPLLEMGIHLILRIFTGKQVTGCIPRIPREGTAPPVIYYANHSSHLDGPLIWYALPRAIRRLTHPIAGKDYWEKNRLRLFLASRVFNVLMLERAQERCCHANRLSELTQALKRGESIILFPEGTRETDGYVTSFKPGLYHLHKQVPEALLIPVRLVNLNRVLPKGSIVPLPCQCRVHFGPPLEILPEEEKTLFLARAREALISPAP